jgi:hypothetical protein
LLKFQSLNEIGKIVVEAQRRVTQPIETGKRVRCLASGLAAGVGEPARSVVKRQTMARSTALKPHRWQGREGIAGRGAGMRRKSGINGLNPALGLSFRVTITRRSLA